MEEQQFLAHKCQPGCCSLFNIERFIFTLRKLRRADLILLILIVTNVTVKFCTH